VCDTVPAVPATSNNTEFAKVQSKLDETLAKLKTVNDPNLRRELLREMRQLVAEAERLAFSLQSSDETIISVVPTS
jgi:hypothetical protein